MAGKTHCPSLHRPVSGCQDPSVAASRLWTFASNQDWMMENKPLLRSLVPTELAALVAEAGLPGYRASQLTDWL